MNQSILKILHLILEKEALVLAMDYDVLLGSKKPRNRQSAETYVDEHQWMNFQK